MSEPPATPRRAKTGGRVAGRSYTPAHPADVGTGGAWPYRDYSGVEPRALRETYEMWQAIARDVADRRRARRWNPDTLAEAAGVSLSTVNNFERGRWVDAHILLRVCAVLDLRVEQTVVVGSPRSRSEPADRSLRARVRPALTDRVATRDELLTVRALLRSLAAHHQLADARIGTDGTVYVHADRDGFAPLWRFAAVASLMLDAWVTVSSDERAARRMQAEPL